MTNTSVLELVAVGKEFAVAGETLSVLQSIDLAVTQGETVAITGVSGSGKSTLLGLMAGLERPTQGEILFEGKAIHHWDEDALANWRSRSVGFIFQNFRLIKNFTALENVSLPLEILGYSARDASTKALQLLDELAVSARAAHFPHQLSGGEQQRVAIARAYSHGPRIIFADEPTGSLDSNTAEKVLSSLLEINQRMQTTLVVVTHDQQVASQLDRQIKLYGGMIA